MPTYINFSIKFWKYRKTLCIVHKLLIRQVLLLTNLWLSLCHLAFLPGMDEKAKNENVVLSFCI